MVSSRSMTKNKIKKFEAFMNLHIQVTQKLIELTINKCLVELKDISKLLTLVMEMMLPNLFSIIMIDLLYFII